MADVLDLFVIYGKEKGYNIVIFDTNTNIDFIGNQRTFRPYFYAAINKGKEDYLVKVLYRSKYKNTVVNVEKTDLLPVLFIEDCSQFIPVARTHSALKIEVDHPRSVPRVADFLSRIMREDRNFMLGATNVKFDVRCSFDLTEGFLTDKDALALLPADEIQSATEEVLKKILDLKIMAFDIEVDARGNFPGPDAPILSVSYVARKLSDVADPKELVDDTTVLEGKDSAAEFLRALDSERPHCIVGYNSYGFDIQYINRNTGTETGKRSYVNRFIVTRYGRLIPHFDLFLILSNLRGAMKVRSHGTYALDDVAVETGVVNPQDPFVEEMLRVEAEMDRTNIGFVYEQDKEFFLKYAKYDVILTLLLAQKWLPAIYMLAALTKVPPTMIQFLNTGQIAEYLVAVYWAEKIGFAPTIRARDPQKEFRKVSLGALKPEEKFYGLGKVYAKRPGVFVNVLELDFDQLYPTIYSSYFVDPTGLISMKAEMPQWIREAIEPLAFGVFLGEREKKSADSIRPLHYGFYAPVYGILTPIFYNLYRMRMITKKLKKQNPYFDVVDQAVKITNNSLFGAFSKRRGNLLNEVASAYIFYKANKILYDVIDFIDSTLSTIIFDKFGENIEVIYGDTDSVFIANVPPEAVDFIEATLNQYIKDKYGKLFSLKKEGYFDLMLLSKRKHARGEEAVRKSYLLFASENGKLRLVEMKGIFYKIDAPEFIKENRAEIFEKIVVEKLSRKELLEYLLKFAHETAKKRPRSLFYHKVSALSLRAEDEPRLKRLNRVEHFAYLYKLNLMGIGKKVEGTFRGGRGVIVEYYVDEIEEKSPVVDIYYIPLQTRGVKKFVIFVGSKQAKFIVHYVTVGRMEILKKIEENNGEEEITEYGYRVSFAVREVTLSEDELINLIYPEIEKFVDECNIYIISYVRQEGGLLEDY